MTVGTGKPEAVTCSSDFQTRVDNIPAWSSGMGQLHTHTRGALSDARTLDHESAFREEQGEWEKKPKLEEAEGGGGRNGGT